jgi:pimeloyl-ACP methyl ester carboxylesterase
MRRVRAADGVPLAVYDFGGRGPDLLLAHATGFHAHIWLPVVEYLRERFRCVAFDERGHGDTPTPANGDFDWRTFGRDALAVVEALGLERPYGVGHSAGGALLLLAEVAAPGTFRALYCWEPVIVPTDDPPPPGDSPMARGARRRREVFASRQEARDRLGAKLPFSLFTPEAFDAYIEHGFDDLPDVTVRLKCRGEDEARTYEHGGAHDAFRHLAEVQCPVAVECGSAPTPFGIEACTQYAARLPHGRVAEVEGLTHFGPMQAPDVLAERIVTAFR